MYIKKLCCDGNKKRFYLRKVILTCGFVPHCHKINNLPLYLETKSLLTLSYSPADTKKIVNLVITISKEYLLTLKLPPFQKAGQAAIFVSGHSAANLINLLIF